MLDVTWELTCFDGDPAAEGKVEADAAADAHDEHVVEHHARQHAHLDPHTGERST